MKEFLELTHFEMIKPTPYGAFHLSVILLSVLAIILFWHRFENKNERQNNRILFFTGVFLLTLEIYKQFYFTHIIGGGHYIWAVFPFQPCSIPMYLCIIMPFIKNKIIKKAFYNYIFIFGTLGGIIVFIFPHNVLTTHLSINFHTLFWHFTLIFLGVFLYKTDMVDLRSGYGQPTLLYLCFAVIALFINILVYKFLNQFISMFFIGPKIENIFLISDLHHLLGWPIASFISVILVCFMGYIFYSFTKYLKK